MAEILNRGMMLITQNLALNQPTPINQVVLAYKSGLDYTTPVNPDEPDPAPAEVVYRGAVTKAAAITPDKVVYSLLLEPTLGPFTFNWMGLVASDGTLVAVSYLPDTVKLAKDESQAGDTLIRNFILAFARASATLDVTISPETWQFDFTDYINTSIRQGFAAAQIEQDLPLPEPGKPCPSYLRFMQGAKVTLLPEWPNGSRFVAEVDWGVNLANAPCLLQADSSILTPNGPADVVKLVETGRQFVFIKINGQWRAS
ncbi:phage tail protein [Aeromonas schubertii]|uniref:Phage tail fibre protein N-terminal domain-containing protein n=1 Tax=Aeromonas schubertii TaxID=652 RepID=A0A0S2SH76_9GAMM|nr:phage tail protein [Aeromonas schubertii]ALP41060.1 hypothetical protein WL1483_1641 [Aeromonas schubertii]